MSARLCHFCVCCFRNFLQLIKPVNRFSSQGQVPLGHFTLNSSRHGQALPAGASSQDSQGETTIVLANFFFQKIQMPLQPHQKGRQWLYFLHTSTFKIDPWNSNDTKYVTTETLSMHHFALGSLSFHSQRISMKLIKLCYLFLPFSCKFNVIELLLCQCLKKNWQKT